MRDETRQKKKYHHGSKAKRLGKQTNEFRAAITESGNYRQQSDESQTCLKFYAVSLTGG
jgi:hypothetical protein